VGRKVVLQGRLSYSLPDESGSSYFGNARKKPGEER